MTTFTQHARNRIEEFHDIDRRRTVYQPGMWHDVWIPTQVNDFMPPIGLWDMLTFWQENAEPVK
jgi:hypothetical protein